MVLPGFSVLSDIAPSCTAILAFRPIARPGGQLAATLRADGRGAPLPAFARWKPRSQEDILRPLPQPGPDHSATNPRRIMSANAPLRKKGTGADGNQRI